MSHAPQSADAALPESLWRDRSFWGMTATQFLGAFNDNLFKQVVLLMCLDEYLRTGGRDYQPDAQQLFALPFVLFSGFAGYLSDRFSKRRIVVICKLAEIGIVGLGAWALSRGSLSEVFAVLFLMGTHSAFFGPSKFGILPELVRENNLSAANGMFLMTTFVGIILGTALAGRLKGYIDQHMTFVACAYVTVAVTGLVTSQFIRRTLPARPGLKFRFADLGVSLDTVRMFWRDRPLLAALTMYSVFWLIGGLTLPAVNAFGKLQLFSGQTQQIADERSSLLAGFLSIGIALGCGTAGWLSGRKVNFRLVPWGCWGMVIGLGLLSLLGATKVATVKPGNALSLSAEIEWVTRTLLILMGFAAGIFTVPLQAFLQLRPPADQKGRVIGAMNLMNWIGILFSASIYTGFDELRKLLGTPPSMIFGMTALLLLPVALWYRPRETTRPA